MTTEELTTEVQKHLRKSDPFGTDGGDITLISIEEGKHVKVRLEGAAPAVA
jgi:Fe-S cluster biogenesis protein NfuA